LVSAGTMGLIRAVDSFKPEHGVKFEIFAARHIRGAVIDHLRAQDPLSSATRTKVRQLDRAVAGLQQSLQREPTLEEVAATAGCSFEEASDLLATASAATLYSIEELLEHGPDLPEGDTPANVDVLTRMERHQLHTIVVRLIEELPRSDRLVLALYYHEGLRMKEIGTVLDVTESRVSQVHARAVATLRGRLRAILEERG
jgi:RNA polymerase sigma factor FliA